MNPSVRCKQWILDIPSESVSLDFPAAKCEGDEQAYKGAQVPATCMRLRTTELGPDLMISAFELRAAHLLRTTMLCFLKGVSTGQEDTE